LGWHFLSCNPKVNGIEFHSGGGRRRNRVHGCAAVYAGGDDMPAKKQDALEPIGKKIKQVRTEKNMTLEQIANETGHSVDYLKAVEAGEERPPVGALLQISRALQVDSAFLLRGKESAIKDRVREYTKRTDEYAYETLTPGAENKHLKAFRVTIEPMKEHSGVGYQHEGEEFNYVIRGTIEVVVGDHVNRMEAGESLHFNSGIKHQLRNVGKEDAELLVVIYTP
jgi:quercetin dioxygenase-like cupin family protein